MEFTLTSRELLIGLLVAVVVYLVEVALFSRKRPAEAKPGKDTKRLETEIEALRRNVERLTAKVNALEQRAEAAPGMVANADAGTRGPLSPEPQSQYSQPAQYARDGLSAEEITARCGISRGEAELLIALHRPDQKPS